VCPLPFDDYKNPEKVLEEKQERERSCRMCVYADKVNGCLLKRAGYPNVKHCQSWNRKDD